MKRSLPVLASLFMAATAIAREGDASVLHGLWRLVSYEVESQATGEKFAAMGAHPTGYADFRPDGRVLFLLTGDGRVAAKDVAGRAALLDSVIAYSGRYRVEGDEWVTDVDVAWNPEWVGTQQRRPFRIVGRRLQILTPWRTMPNWAEKGVTRSIVTFEREP